MIKARWVCEQAHQQPKEELGLDHFEGRSWHGLHTHFSNIAASQKWGGKKRINGPPPRPALPAIRHAIVDLITRSSPRRCSVLPNLDRHAKAP
jgi:SRSO17 transposase